MEEALKSVVIWSSRIAEASGIAVIIGGGALATGVFLYLLVQRHMFQETYRSYRQNLGRAILLGLELLVAADIIRTVAVDPTLQSVAALGLIVLIRTFLSFSLEVEINGRWPWQHSGDERQEPVSS